MRPRPKKCKYKIKKGEYEMSGNKIFKSVSFNILNPDDVKMLEYFKRRNFSGYVKKLILEDINKNEEKKAPKEPSQNEILTTAQKLEQMKSQLKANKGINGTKNLE